MEKGDRAEGMGRNFTRDEIEIAARRLGLIERAAIAGRYMIDGVTPRTWMSPSQPIRPIADAEEQGADGRKFDFPIGSNIRITPRGDELIGFDQLRSLADNYDLMRLVIETRKDQIEAYDWEIVPLNGAKGKEKECAELSRFFENPSMEYDWQGWLRAMMEDVLVVDALAIYPRRTFGGKVASLDLIDGATIKRLIDQTGRTPSGDNPAYQQVLKGIPAANYTASELLYYMRNPRTNRVYGMSPVEQVVMTVNIALRRQLHVLNYYTEGNVPEAIAGVDPNWTADQIQEFQTLFDMMLSGDLAKRRRITFVPSEAANIKFTREAQLKDMMDEWLARIVCFAFSIPPTAFVAQVNRSTSETMNDAAKEEGLIPLLRWVRRKINHIIRTVFGVEGVEFRWKLEDGMAPEVKSRMELAEVCAGARLLDEYRAARGMTELEDGLGAKPMVISGASAMLLSEAVKAKAGQTEKGDGDVKGDAGGSTEGQEGDAKEKPEV